ncbi:hypothetical protein AO1008_06067 [Aspergillus oryzae 100-8]|uniref:Uncharacterized protein n=1 Tax=Aspergillus oryzae (strain 3.042) TaxID=1160506 RepID=I8TUQ6_ASPO3|nr:hypothetical protein Ao3042_05768 [Aspergillus oryzae 3.042]KDE79402.1 hypothetical protein AO1008_06067 [Aspergillus oryzae 100-8]|eukprot:EIT78120.1 hypothetical protein Ao3042_05768 [Aspergillus oryzae 3.042]
MAQSFSPRSASLMAFSAHRRQSSLSESHKLNPKPDQWPTQQGSILVHLRRVGRKYGCSVEERPGLQRLLAIHCVVPLYSQFVVDSEYSVAKDRTASRKSWSSSDVPASNTPMKRLAMYFASRKPSFRLSITCWRHPAANKVCPDRRASAAHGKRPPMSQINHYSPDKYRFIFRGKLKHRFFEYEGAPVFCNVEIAFG